MAQYEITCEAEGCEADNKDYEYKDGTFWFVCHKCGYENEVVERWWA